MFQFTFIISHRVTRSTLLTARSAAILGSNSGASRPRSDHAKNGTIRNSVRVLSTVLNMVNSSDPCDLKSSAIGFTYCSHSNLWRLRCHITHHFTYHSTRLSNANTLQITGDQWRSQNFISGGGGIAFGKGAPVASGALSTLGPGPRTLRGRAPRTREPGITSTRVRGHGPPSTRGPEPRPPGSRGYAHQYHPPGGSGIIHQEARAPSNQRPGPRPPEGPGPSDPWARAPHPCPSMHFS